MPETRLFAARVDGCIVVLYAVRITYVPLVKNLREKGKLFITVVCGLRARHAPRVWSCTEPEPAIVPATVKGRVEPR